MSNRLRLTLAVAVLAVAGCDSNPNNLPAELFATQTTVDFGRRSALAPPTVRAVTIQNAGGSPSAPIGVMLDGSGRAAFRIDTASSTCIGRRLEAARSCVVTVLLGGPASGPVAATLLVGDPGAGTGAVGVGLTGVIESKLNVYFQGTGHGVVSESSHNSSCDAVCTLTLDVPTVTLTATPDAESTFGGWAGAPGCTTATTCTLTLVDLNAVTVMFAPLP